MKHKTSNYRLLQVCIAVGVLITSSIPIALCAEVTTKAVTEIPLADGYSVVLINETTNCRYIGSVQQTHDTNHQGDLHWSIHLNEKWCRTPANRSERVLDFKKKSIGIIKAYAANDVILMDED